MSCFLFPPPTVTVVYCYPKMGGEHDAYGKRFADSYRSHAAGHPHELLLVSNGGKPTNTMQDTINGIPCRWMEHDDSGWDIGAFQKAAKENQSLDLMVFLGGSSYVQREGWLARMVEAYRKHGIGLYGSMGNAGISEHNVFPHIRTTGFWINPELLGTYPNTVRSRPERYPFEHGQRNLTNWIISLGLTARVVTWTDELNYNQWNMPISKENLLVRDRISDL